MSNWKDTVGYVWPIIAKRKFSFWSLFLLTALRFGTISIFLPILYKRIVDIISAGNFDRASVKEPLFDAIFLIVLIFPIGWFLGRATQYAMSKFQSVVIKDLHDFTFSRLHRHSYTFFADNFAGALVNKCRKFVRAFEQTHDIIIDNYWNSFVILTSVFVVFYMEAKIIAFIFLGMSVIYLAIILVLSKKKVEYDLAEAAADTKVTASIADTITNFLPIKSSSSLEREIEDYKKVTAKEAHLRLRAWIFGNKINAIQSGISMVVQILVVFITGYMWLDGRISAGLFVLVQSYSQTVGNNFWDLGKATTKFTKSMSDMKEMVDIFKKTPDVLDPALPEVPRIKEGKIEIKNMSFDYGIQDVFKDFSLTVKPGERVGLVGHSGSGKSTITKLIMRFLDIKDGEILIDGQDIRKITQDDLRKSISYIAQEPILFHRSIKENIAYSKPEATMEEIIEVSKKAHAHEFISNLKYGYDTLVGERGVKLSGGERQRVAIARAMLKDAPILILDEATSSLDSISESYIQSSFADLMKDKTTIVIAHRLSTIQKMDRIVVLDKGRIVEEGTHSKLLSNKSLYYDLWTHQTGGFLV